MNVGRGIRGTSPDSAVDARSQGNVRKALRTIFLIMPGIPKMSAADMRKEVGYRAFFPRCFPSYGKKKKRKEEGYRTLGTVKKIHYKSLAAG